MNCQKVQENFWEYYRRQLEPDLILETTEHLRRCPSCAAQFENLKQVDFELNRLDEIEPSPYFDQKLNAKLDALEKKQTWLGRLIFWLKDSYALSFALLLIATVSVWIGFRHQQFQKLTSMEEVIETQDRYLRNIGKSASRTTQAPSALKGPWPQTSPDNRGQIPSAEEEFIPEEDKAVVENIELLENYDFLNQFDLADIQAEAQQTVKSD